MQEARELHHRHGAELMEVVRFSVIIPLYNKANHIHRALNSVLSQSVQDFEIIVVDDGSTDNGAEVVQSVIDPRISLIRQINAGVSAARNRGIEAAAADLVAFLDADDAWEPMFLEAITLLVKKFPQAGLYATAYTVCEPSGKLKKPRYIAIPDCSREVLIPSYFHSTSSGDSPVWTSAVCIPKTVFSEVGVFPLGEKLGEDHDMWSRIALKYSIAFSWTVGAIYFLNSENRACKQNLPHKNMYYIRNLQDKLDRNEVPPALKVDVNKFISKQLIGIAAKNLCEGNNSEAKLILSDVRAKLLFKKWLWWRVWSLFPHQCISIARNFKYLFSSL